MSLFSWFTHTFKPRAQAPRRAPGTPARPHAGSAAPAPAPQARNSKPLAHQPTTRDQETERKNITEVIIAKHRNGPIGTIELFFQKEFTKFRDLSRME